MDVSVRASEVVYRGHLSTVRVDRLVFPDGHETEREVVEHLDAVAVVPLHDDGTVTLLRQYRHALGESVLEIPAGLRDVDDEPAAETARRELAEEARLSAGSLEHLVTFANSAGWTDETTSVFLATELDDGDVPDGFRPEAEEAQMGLERLTLDAAIAQVRDEHADAKTLIGLLLADRARR